MYISVIGASTATPRQSELAEAVGRLIAERGHTLVCGGLGGVMDAAAKGAASAGGLAVGILPGEDRVPAGKYLTVALPTGMGHGRNYLVALAADGLIAVGGEYGTLSEISFGLKRGRPIVLLESWELAKLGISPPNLKTAKTPEEAVDTVEKLMGGDSSLGSE